MGWLDKELNKWDLVVIIAEAEVDDGNDDNDDIVVVVVVVKGIASFNEDDDDEFLAGDTVPLDCTFASGLKLNRVFTFGTPPLSRRSGYLLFCPISPSRLVPSKLPTGCESREWFQPRFRLLAAEKNCFSNKAGEGEYKLFKSKWIGSENNFAATAAAVVAS